MNLIDFVGKISESCNTQVSELVSEYYDQITSLYHTITHLPDNILEDIGTSEITEEYFCIPLLIKKDTNIDEVLKQLEESTDSISFSIDKKQNCINCKL